MAWTTLGTVFNERVVKDFSGVLVGRVEWLLHDRLYRVAHMLKMKFQM